MSFSNNRGMAEQRKYRGIAVKKGYVLANVML